MLKFMSSHYLKPNALQDVIRILVKCKYLINLNLSQFVINKIVEKEGVNQSIIFP